MNISSQFIDKVAISISSLCVAHCLIFPVMVVLIPSLSVLGLTSESFHFWMIVTVIPSSIYALAIGCKKHAQISICLIGALGLSCLIFAFLLGADILGERGEKVLTLFGAIHIAMAHIKNFKLCQQHKNCECPNKHKPYTA